MKDSEFKRLGHVVGENRIGSRGTEIAPGYKPDLTLVDRSGTVQFILECEQKTDRKSFIGDFIKAEKYACDHNAQPSLVIVMQETGNQTTVRQISQHLQPYVSWLASLRGGKLNVRTIIVMSDSQYLESVAQNEEVGSSQFQERGSTIQL